MFLKNNPGFVAEATTTVARLLSAQGTLKGLFLPRHRAASTFILEDKTRKTLSFPHKKYFVGRKKAATSRKKHLEMGN